MTAEDLRVRVCLTLDTYPNPNKKTRPYNSARLMTLCTRESLQTPFRTPRRYFIYKILIFAIFTIFIYNIYIQYSHTIFILYTVLFYKSYNIYNIYKPLRAPTWCCLPLARGFPMTRFFLFWWETFKCPQFAFWVNFSCRYFMIALACLAGECPQSGSRRVDPSPSCVQRCLHGTATSLAMAFTVFC